MGVSNERTNFFSQYFFNRTVKPATGDPVGIKHPLFAVRGSIFLPVTNGLPSEVIKI